MSSSSKRPRTNDSSSIDESLDNLEQLATALGQVGVHSISNAQFNRIANIASILQHKHQEHRMLEERLKREREANGHDEQCLPADLLSHTLAYLKPTQIAIAGAACRHFQAAAKRAVLERGRRIGIVDAHLESLGAKMLVRLEKEAQLASEHFHNLHLPSSRVAIEENHLSKEIVTAHVPSLMARVKSLIDKGEHLKPKPTNDGNDDDAEFARRHLDIYKSELQATIELLRKADPDFCVQYYDTMIMLAVKANDDELAISASTMLYTYNEKAAATILRLDPQLAAFKRALAVSNDLTNDMAADGLSSEMRTGLDVRNLHLLNSTLRRLKHLPSHALAPLLSDFQHIAETRSETARTAARKLLIDFESASRGSVAEPVGLS